ncbi:MAG: hypothetical protein UY81_C0049G0012 [Candidatus Giovannonibacteria bacterium GW2011_GWA2_53_7]|uniref:Uncharacterized protein n=1 Tax=Candidatus Giovannonibacteria bacterium GW2011_GWA2_53_7 TaxID=1618650 RepID=A0A0G1XW84_9BACT|nr:MAG: hypothetical protein UY81_C0049G0012 [Candidatus Giovannonibacteria bacterium GW2011_GWA2_53_7]
MRPLVDLMNGLLLVIGAAWNYFILSLGWVNKQLTVQDWHKVGRKLRNWGVAILLVLLLAGILGGCGLYIGYFRNPAAGTVLMLLSAIMLVIIVSAFKVIEMALGLAIFTLLLAKSISINPALWTLQQGGKFIWQTGTWPIKFSWDAVTAVLKGALMFLGVDAEAIETLHKKRFNITPAKHGPWDEAKKRVDEMAAAARGISHAATIGFKYITAFIFSASFIIWTKWQFSPEGSAAIFTNPVFTGLALFVMIAFFVDKAIWEHRARMAKLTGDELERRKKSFKTSTKIAVICMAVILVFLEWRFQTVTNTSYYWIHMWSAEKVLENKEIDRRTQRIENLLDQRKIEGGKTYFLASKGKKNVFVIPKGGNGFPVAAADSLQPGKLLTFEVVHLEAEYFDEQLKQMFVIFTRYDEEGGFLIPNKYYAVLYKYAKTMNVNDLSDVTMQEEVSFCPSPPSIIYQGEEELDTGIRVKAGDVVTMKVTFEKLSYASDSYNGTVKGLAGTGTSALGTPKIPRGDRTKFVAPSLPVGAIIVHVPGYGQNGTEWTVAQQTMTFVIPPGKYLDKGRYKNKIIISSNSQRRYFTFVQDGRTKVMIEYALSSPPT